MFTTQCIFGASKYPATEFSGGTLVGGSAVTLFQTEQAIYNPDDTITFNITLDNDSAYSSFVKISVTNEIGTKQTVHYQSTALTSGAQSLSPGWNSSVYSNDTDRQGHIAELTIYNTAGDILGQATHVFDITSDWSRVIRYITYESNTITRSSSPYTDGQIDAIVQNLRELAYNGLEIYKTTEPYDLNQTAATFVEPNYNTSISKERMQYVGTALHSQGMKYIAYNEMETIRGLSDTSKVFESGLSAYRQVAVYPDGTWQNYWAPNYDDSGVITKFSNAVADSIGTYDWDAVFMDSGISCGKENVTGGMAYYDSTGTRIRGGTASEVGDYCATDIRPSENSRKSSKE